MVKGEACGAVPETQRERKGATAEKKKKRSVFCLSFDEAIRVCGLVSPGVAHSGCGEYMCVGVCVCDVKCVCHSAQKEIARMGRV